MSSAETSIAQSALAISSNVQLDELETGAVSSRVEEADSVFAEPAFVDPFPDDPFRTNQLPSYTFDPALSVDDNMMVWTLIYARLSISRRGNMAAIIVGPSPSAPPPPSTSSNTPTTSTRDQPIALLHSNNTPLPSPSLQAQQKHPELHAEARCITLAARQGIPLLGCTIYVSFPPCAACLQLIVSCGITRCVYRRRLLGEESIALAKEEGVECVEVVEYAKDEELKRRAGVWWEAQGETKDRAKNREAKWWREAGPAYGDRGGKRKAEGGEGQVAEGNEGKQPKKRKGEKGQAVES